MSSDKKPYLHLRAPAISAMLAVQRFVAVEHLQAAVGTSTSLVLMGEMKLG